MLMKQCSPAVFPSVHLYVCVFQDGTEPVVKDVLPGDSVHSLLSILDIITVSSF